MSQVPPFTALSQAAESLLGQLADEVQSARQRGEAVDLEALAGQYPQLADVIRQVFPALGALGASVATFAPLSGTESLGDFRLVRELGRGGMGIVYEAEQRSLGRRVALKILPLAAMLDERQLRRFRNEAHAAAVLKHPHIVSVYAVGCERGVHFYAMELVEGCSLADLLRPAEAQELPLPLGEGWGEGPSGLLTSSEWSAQRALQDGASTVRLAAASTLLSGDARSRSRAVAQLGVTVAEALAYAHREGVIHRDIKPANLLLDRAGKLWIADFGLARVGTAGDLTMTGDVLGTLRYMSPEQLRGDTVVDERTDVYSLGLTLYEALVGRPAFGAGARESLVRQVLEHDPPPPRKLAPELAADLETIVLRAIEKDRDRRYASAGELADDLRRYLEHRPIKARRSTWWQTASRWRRRNPGLAVLLGLLACAGLVLGIGGPLAAVRQAQLAREMDRRLYVADMNLAYEAWYEGNVERTEQLLARHATRAESADQRDFAWKYLKEQLAASERTILHQYGGRLNTLAVSPDGKTLATAGNHTPIVLLDLDSGQQLRLLDDEQDTGRIWSADFSADGSRLASGGQDGILRIWDVSSGQALSCSRTYTEPIRSVRFTPADDCIVGTEDGKLASWSITGDLLWENQAHRQCIWKIAVSADGRRVATASDDQTIRMWHTPTGKIDREIAKLESLAFSVAFSWDGKTLVGGGAEGVYLWDAATGTPLRGLNHGLRPTAALAISRDGLLATSSFDNVVQIWDLKRGFRLDRFIAHRDHAWAVSFTPDGRHLLSAAVDGTVRRFDLALARAMRQRLQDTDVLWSGMTVVGADARIAASVLGPDPDSQWLPATSELNLWDIGAGRPRWTQSVDIREAGGVAIAPDGKRLLACGRGGVTFREVVSGAAISRLEVDGDAHLVVPALSTSGRWLAAGGWRGTLARPTAASMLVWDLSQSAPFARELLASAGSNRVFAVAFSDDGRFLAAAHGKQAHSAIDVWSWIDNGWQLHSRPAVREGEPFNDVRFLPGTHSILSVDQDGVVELCDLDRGTAGWRFRADAQGIFSSSVSHDGKVLALGLDREIKLWNIETRDQLCTIEVPLWVRSLAFAPDGQTLVWAGGDGQVRFERTKAISP